MQVNVNAIFEQALKDPSLFSTLDIDALLDSIENDRNDYLENKTMKDVTQNIYDKINALTLTNENKKDICQKLIGYRYVDEMNELHKGKHVRWIRTNHSQTPLVLTNGGIVTDIKFVDNGTQVLCMNSGRRFIQYKFDDCITFQKLSVEEQLILMAYDYTSKMA